MPKKINANNLFFKVIAVILCFCNLMCVSPKADFSQDMGSPTLSQTENSVKVPPDNKISDLQEAEEKTLQKKIDDKIKSETKSDKEKLEEGKLRKVCQKTMQLVFYILFRKIVPSFNIKQSDLNYAENVAKNYTFWNLSGEICAMLGIKNKTKREYTLKKIGKTAANLLSRLCCMVALNKVVPKNILHDKVMGFVSENVDRIDDITDEDKAKLKNCISKLVTFSEYNARDVVFRIIAVQVPKLVGF